VAKTSTTRQNLVAPNLPNGPREYTPQYQEQLNNVHRLFYNSVVNEVNSPYPYGSFFTAPTTITNPVANTQNLVPFTKTAEAFNTKLGGTSSSRVYVSETGVYNIQFSAQLDKTGGGASSAYFWLRKDGVNVADTAGKIVVNGPNDEKLAAWNYLITLAEGSYIELAWESSDTAMILPYEAATGDRPAVPAVILTIMWASSVNRSTGLSQ
jgi:hypothetical protein